jgi:hypothetical protein
MPPPPESGQSGNSLRIPLRLSYFARMTRLCWHGRSWLSSPCDSAREEGVHENRRLGRSIACGAPDLSGRAVEFAAIDKLSPY